MAERLAPRVSSIPPGTSRSTSPPPASHATSRPPSSEPQRASYAPSSLRPGEEVILAFPLPRPQIAPSTMFRSTWIVSSLQSLRERGHFERYATMLSGHRSDILECVAGTWLSLSVAQSHYEACDALRLPTEEQLAMGRTVGARAQGTILATAVKAARGAGVTPWTILPQFDRLWRRGANGGGIAVIKTGPKEARVEICGCSLFDIDYFRHAFRGVLLGIGDMFCRTPYVHDLPRRTTGEAWFHLQWV